MMHQTGLCLCLSLLIAIIGSICTCGRTNEESAKGPALMEGNERQRRQSPRPDLTVELYFAMDYAAYHLWYNLTQSLRSARPWTSSTHLAKQITEMYTLHVHGVNERFQSIQDSSFTLNIEMNGMYIATLPTKQSWIRYNSSLDTADFLSSHFNHSLDLNASLAAFQTWTTGQYNEHPADHYIWITGYDMGKLKSQGYNVSMCTNRSISVVKEDIDFIIQTRIAQRIGLSLGLTVDSQRNDCDDDGYVMTPDIYPRSKDGDNLWEFSDCSESELEDIVESPNRSCLVKDSSDPLTLLANFTLPGVFIEADHQCEFVFGQSFVVCREKYGNQYNDICHGLWCCNKTGIVHKMIPMDGTSCDAYKRCKDGDCDVDLSIHATDNVASCLFGDYPYHFNSQGNYSCWYAAKHHSALCYDTKFRSTCCLSCLKEESYSIPGCQFGDRENYCDEIDPWDCYNKQNRDDCCQTCESHRTQLPGCDYGDRIDVCDARNVSECYNDQTRHDCCFYCEENKSGQPGCEYGDRIDSCETRNVSQCYNVQTRHDCCLYCHENKSSQAGCEHGDRIPGCELKDVSECYNTLTRTDCCLFCNEHDTGKSNCPYGDRIADCVSELCSTYTQYKRTRQCCLTCSSSGAGPTTDIPATTTIPSTTFSTTPAPTTESSSLSSSPTSAGKGGSNMGVIVGASVGGVVLVLVIIVAVICWRKRRGSELKHLSPISDVMYNEYKLSKRAPMPEPRDFKKPKSGSKQKLMKQDSEVYAYINPDDVDNTPARTGTTINPQNDVKKGRNEDDPLPPTPGDYLELKVVDKYGYMEPVEKNKNKPNPYSEPYSDNQNTAYVDKARNVSYKNAPSAKDGSVTR